MAENIEKLILDDSGFINPLKESIKVMEDAEKAFKELNTTQTQGSQKAANEIKKGADVQKKAIEDVMKAAKIATMSQDEHVKKIKETAGAMLSSGDTAKKFSDILKKIETVKLSGAKADIQDIEKEFTALLSTVKLTDEQIEFLTNNIQEVAAEISQLDGNEIDQLAQKSENLTNEFTSAKGELRALTNLINSGQLTGDELLTAERRAAELTDTIGDVRDKIKQLSSDTRGLDLMVEGVTAVGAGFQLAEGAMALMGDESKEMQQTLIKLNAVMAISNGLQQVGEVLTRKGGIAQLLYSTAVGTSTGALKLFRLALIGTGIGALVVLLSVLVANWDKVKKSVNENAQAVFDFGKKVTYIIPPLNLLIKGIEWLYNNFSRLDNIAKGAIDGVVAGLGAVGDVVSKLFKGDFSGAYEAAKQVGTKIGTAVNEGIAESEKADANSAQAKVIDGIVATQKKRLAVLEAGGKDTAKLQKTILENELKSLKLSGAEKQSIEDKQQEIAVFNAERAKAAADKAAAAEKKRIADREDALKNIKQLQEELFNISDKTDKEKFDFVKQKNIDQLVLFRSELKKAADVAGKDLTPELKAFDEIINAAKLKEYVDVVGELPKKLEDISLKSIKPIDFKLKVNVSTETSENGDFLDGIENFEDLLQKSLDELFGSAIDGENAREFISSASLLVGEFGNILNEATDIQLSNIDKQLDKLSERRENLQDELAAELELQEKGLANNVGNKQAEVDGLIAEENRLLAEREKIQKEAAKRQLIADTIQQTQSLITSSINIIKGFSNIPIVGLPLGIAAAGALLAFFAKTKVEAFKATKLYTGAEKISDHFGYGDRYGDTDLPGRGSGYRLVNERTGLPSNVVISGKEMLLPESVSLPNSEFFHSLRNGMYNGIDLNAAMGFYLNYKGKLQKANQSTVIVSQNKPQSKERNRIAIPHVNKSGRKGIIVTTIKDDWTDGKFIEIDF